MVEDARADLERHNAAFDETALELGSPPPPDARQDALDKAAVRSQLFGSRTQAPTIGRYTVLELLGQGGMGTVYACFDDQLDRRVALKVVKAAQSEEARQRMLREAQAMAKLSHPNVVPVFEVGEHEAELYVSMEYVKGDTLAVWQAGGERDWTEVVAMYLQAGEGLAAAHASGLVHRDFKPHNAIVGLDGRVRVLDFGLAARQGGPQPVQTDAAPTRRTDAALDTPLTATGAVMGTPAYMSPEQFRGGAVDARSDQFSFCVALWEGLYGQRPFAGGTQAQLFAAITEGRLEVPGRTRVPFVLRELLEPGLRSDPDERWPDLDALLTELRRTIPAQDRGRMDAKKAEARATLAAVAGWSVLLYLQSLLRGPTARPDRDSVVVLGLFLLVAGIVGTAVVGWAARRRALRPAPTRTAWWRLGGLSGPWLWFSVLSLTMWTAMVFILTTAARPETRAMLVNAFLGHMLLLASLPAALWVLERVVERRRWQTWLGTRCTATLVFATAPLQLASAALWDPIAVTFSLALPCIIATGVAASLRNLDGRP